jgi:hypothetical protein
VVGHRRFESVAVERDVEEREIADVRVRVEDHAPSLLGPLRRIGQLPIVDNQRADL